MATEAPPDGPAPFYTVGISSVEAAFMAVITVFMGAISLAWAEQQLVALGLTLATAAAFLATPRMLSNSVLRYLQAKWLSKWAGLPDQNLKDHPVAKRWLRRILGSAVLAILLEVVSVVWLSEDSDSEVALAIFAGGGLTLMAALVGSYVWSAGVLIAEAVRGDARATRGEVRAPDPLDWAWVAVLVLFVAGALFQFADAVLPDAADACLRELARGATGDACEALD